MYLMILKYSWNIIMYDEKDDNILLILHLTLMMYIHILLLSYDDIYYFLTKINKNFYDLFEKIYNKICLINILII